MSPLAPIRMLFLTFVSWSILAAGIYFSYEAYRAFSRPSQLARPISTDPIATDPIATDPIATDPIATDPIATDPIATDPIATDPIRLREVDAEPNKIDVARTVEVQSVREPDIGRANEWWPWVAVGLAVLFLGWSMAGRLPVRLIFMQGASNTSAQQAQRLVPSQTIWIDRPCGSRLYVETYGAHNGPTIVMTHGWSLDSTAWKYTLPKLAAHYRVVVWDLAGLGKSRGPHNNNYSVEKMSLDLQAVIDEACGKGPVMLIGHSIGGMIQQTYCRTNREHLNENIFGMVLVHTTYTNPLSTNIASVITKPLEPLVSLLNGSMIVLSPLYWLSNWQSYWNGTSHWAARLESFSGRQSWEQLDFSAWKGAVASPSVVARGNYGMLKFDEQNTLPQVNVPVLVISGRNDRLTTASASGHIEALLPNNTAYDDDGGHLGHVENCEAVSQRILHFATQVFSHELSSR